MAENIDLSDMTAEELDRLIVEAAKKRAAMEPPVPGEHPKSAQAIVNPAWYTEAIDIGALLQVRHPGFGWLSFVFPHAERAHLLSVWLHQSLTFKGGGTMDIKPAPGFRGGVH